MNDGWEARRPVGHQRLWTPHERAGTFARTVGKPTLIGIALLVTAATIAAPASTSWTRAAPLEPTGLAAVSSSIGDPYLVSPGTWGTFACTHGTISLQGSVVCSHTTTAPVLLCDSSSCGPSKLVGTVDSGYTFYGWNLSGQASVSCEYYCLTTSLTVYTPNPSDKYSAYIQLDTTSPPPAPPTCGGAPTITNWPHNPTPQGGYRQVWINWSYTIPTSPIGWQADFMWWQGSTELTIPDFNSSSTTASINLNDLAADTTYTYEVAVWNCGGPAVDTGSFTTTDAPLNEYVGWVYGQSFSPYKLNPEGSPVSGAVITLLADCPNGQQVFGGDYTKGDGSYALPLPESLTMLNTWQDVLWQSGWCSESEPNMDGVWVLVGNTSNSQYTLVAHYEGDWNVTQVVSSTFSPSQDFAQFVLPPDNYGNIPIGFSLIHTTFNSVQYYDAECGFAFQASQSQSTVQQTVNSLSDDYFGYSGQSSTTEGTSDGSQWQSPASWGNDTGLQLVYTYSGFEWESNQTIANSFVVSGEVGANYNPYTTSDWLPAPSPLPAARPAGYQFQVIPSTATRASPASYTVFSGGTFSSMSSDEVEFKIPLEWGGASVTPSIQLSYSTTITTQSGYNEACSFAYTTDPSGHQGEPYFYYYNEDTGVSSSVVHVWLEGWCNWNNNPNNPEQTCP